jgi:hypothetical protein
LWESTRAQFGRGDKAKKIWQSSWLNGKASMDLAPHLYPLAWRKNQSVKIDLTNMNWTRVFGESVQQIYESVQLWDLVQNQQLNDQDDEIDHMEMDCRLQC